MGAMVYSLLWVTLHHQPYRRFSNVNNSTGGRCWRHRQPALQCRLDSPPRGVARFGFRMLENTGSCFGLSRGSDSPRAFPCRVNVSGYKWYARGKTARKALNPKGMQPACHSSVIHIKDYQSLKLQTQHLFRKPSCERC